MKAEVRFQFNWNSYRLNFRIEDEEEEEEEEERRGEEG